MPETNPQESDAVLGGQNPPPINAAILGGLAGAKQRLESESIVAKIQALKDTIQYGTDGINLALEALADPNDDVKRFARRLLRDRAGEAGKAALLDREPLSYFTTLADWRWEIYNPEIGIVDPENNAYVVQMTDSWEYSDRYDSFLGHFESLLKDPKIGELKALIVKIEQEFIFTEEDPFAKALAAICDAGNLFANLRGLYIGDSKEEWPTGYRRSKLSVSDIRPFLESFPTLEILQVFGRFTDDEYQDEGYTSLNCAGLRHENLKTLIIETAHLAGENLNQIGRIELPSLEYFELWLGKIDIFRYRIAKALKPILFDNASPNLKYLGLCSDNDTDSLIIEVLTSPIIDRLAVLDFKMGTMTLKGAEYLLNSPDLRNLKYLNVFGNYLSESTIAKLQELPCQINSDSPPYPAHEGGNWDRRCEGHRRWALHE
ncbi:hypothetical protein [Chamaesiphon sp. VAR_48_metabat_403]|uniref:hypothetical protein n=1 Tax=Chamaesiphon sp. VAR_48_metabat_403 TaxID=2964700 RepID=UPI00286DE0A8|nr:hypothetical protein [Chamaesiphon sp. VAR_48_metabat_403]